MTKILYNIMNEALSTHGTYESSKRYCKKRWFGLILSLYCVTYYGGFKKANT